MDQRYEVLDDAARLAREYVDSLQSRPVSVQADIDELRSRLARPLSDDGEDPRAVIEDLARDVEPGLVASAGPRYFGFVIGGALPVADMWRLRHCPSPRRSPLAGCEICWACRPVVAWVS